MLFNYQEARCCGNNPKLLLSGRAVSQGFLDRFIALVNSALCWRVLKSLLLEVCFAAGSRGKGLHLDDVQTKN